MRSLQLSPHHSNLHTVKAFYRRLRSRLQSDNTSAVTQTMAPLAGSGTGLNSILMFVKSIPLLAVPEVLADPNTFEFAQNAIMPISVESNVSVFECEYVPNVPVSCMSV